MSQTLQNQILMAKSMNGIITLSDGAGTTITNGQIVTTDISSNSFASDTMNINTLDVNTINIQGGTINNQLGVIYSGSVQTGDLQLTGALELERSDTLNTFTTAGSVSLWEKGRSYFADTLFSSGIDNFTGNMRTTQFQYVNSSSAVTIVNPYFGASSGNPAFNGTGTYSISGWSFNSANTYRVYLMSSTISTPDYRYIQQYPPNTSFVILENTVTANITMQQTVSLSAGAHILFWSSYYGWNSGVKVTLSIASQTFTYDDSTTRDIGQWRSRNFQFNVNAAGSYTILFTVAGNSSFCDVFFANFSLTRYNALQVMNTAGTKSAFISPDIAVLNAPYFKGTTNAEAMVLGGSLTMGTPYGSNNISINNTFGTGSTTNNNNNICVGINTGTSSLTTNNSVFLTTSASNTFTSVLESVIIGARNNISNTCSRSYIMGANNGSSGNRNILIGYRLGGDTYNAGSDNVCIGRDMLAGYNGFGSYITTPANNYLYGTNILTSTYYDLSNCAFGQNIFQNLKGNNNNPPPWDNLARKTSFNIGIGINVGNTPSVLNNSVLIGCNANASDNLTNVVALGHNCTVTTSNTIQLGSNSETVAISGDLKAGANTITSTQLGYLTSVTGGIVNTGGSQTILGTKTFSGGINATLAQTINFGSNAPTMSGANIETATIPSTAVTNVVDLNSSQTITGLKTFKVASGTSLIWGYPTGGRFVVTNDETPTPKSLIRFNRDNISVAVGHNALTNETQGISANNSSFGEDSLINTVYARYCSAFGGNALKNTTSATGGNFSQCTGVGYNAGQQNTTGLNNCFFGVNSGENCTTGNNNTFIGTGTNFLSTATQYSNSTAIGYGVRITASNQCKIADSASTVVIDGTLDVNGPFIADSTTTLNNTVTVNGVSTFNANATYQSTVIYNDVVTFNGLGTFGNDKIAVGATKKQYLRSSYPSVITGSFDISAQAYVHMIYPVNPTSAMTITLPPANADNVGMRITIRRVGGSGTLPVVSVTPSFYPNNSLAATTTLLGTAGWTGHLYCTYLTNTTFGWFRE